MPLDPEKYTSSNKKSKLDPAKYIKSDTVQVASTPKLDKSKYLASSTTTAKKLDPARYGTSSTSIKPSGLDPEKYKVKDKSLLDKAGKLSWDIINAPSNLLGKVEDPIVNAIWGKTGGRATKSIFPNKKLDIITSVEKKTGFDLPDITSRQIADWIGKEAIRPSNIVLGKLLTRGASKAGKVLSSINVDDIPVPSTMIKQIGLTEYRRILKEAQKAIIDNPEYIMKNPIAQDILAENDRLFKTVIDMVDQGVVDLPSIPAISKAYGITPKEIYAKLAADTSKGGKILNLWKQLKHDRIKLGLSEEDLAEIGVNITKPSMIERGISAYRKMDNVRRALLTTQISTTMRNIYSQMARQAVRLPTHVLNGIGEIALGKSTLKQAFIPLQEDIYAVLGRFDNKKKAALRQLLEANPLHKARLLNESTAELTMGSRFMRILTALNTKQEHFFRKMTFESVVRSELRRVGMTMEDMATASPQFVESVLNKGVKEALEATFALTPAKGTWGSAIMKAYDVVPPLTIVHPFPRFMINATNFIWDHSPMGFTKLLGTDFWSDLASTGMKSREAIDKMSRAMVGTMMWAGAMQVRQNDQLRGDKWYEVKHGSKTIDTRPYNPFAQYLFLSEAFRNPEGLTNRDWLAGFFDMGRITDNIYPFVDLARESSSDKKMDSLLRVAGNYLGGFTVPLKTFADVAAQYDEEESYVRSTTENKFLGPIIKNVPYARQVLPKARSFTRGTPLKQDLPLFRQITGVSFKEKTPLESEIERAGEDLYEVGPRTGFPKLNRYMSQEMGQTVEDYGDRLVKSPGYLSITDPDKKLDYIKFFLSAVSKSKRPYALVRFIDEEMQSMINQEAKIEFIKKLDKRSDIPQWAIERAKKALL